METTIEKLQWNSDGKEAERRLQRRGIRKYSYDEYAAEFKAVRNERLSKEQDRRDQIQSYIRSTQQAGIRNYSQAAQSVIQDDFKKYSESDTTAKHRLAKVLLAAKDSSTGKISVDLALELMKALPSDVMQASNLRLDELAHDALKNSAHDGLITSERLQAAMNGVLREFPALKAAITDGSASRELLDILYWPMAHVFA